MESQAYAVYTMSWNFELSSTLRAEANDMHGNIETETGELDNHDNNKTED